MKGAMVATLPLFEVAEITEVYCHDKKRALVRFLDKGRHRHECESFAWEDLLVLSEARRIADAPSRELETDYGPLLIEATAEVDDGSSCHWGDGPAEVLRDTVHVRSPRDETTTGYEYRHLEINGVEYSFSGSLARSSFTDKWKSARNSYLSLYRMMGGDTTESARKKAHDLEPIIFAWLDSPEGAELLAEGRAVKLSNEIARAEGKVLASKRGYEAAIKERANLLAMEEAA